jgi:hypothetical protein
MLQVGATGINEPTNNIRVCNVGITDGKFMKRTAEVASGGMI